MFDNIGGKIKVLAKCICWLGIIGSIICAIALFSTNSYYNPTIGLGIGVLIGGCLGSWVGSFFTYGFGELVSYASYQLAKKDGSSQIYPKWQCSNCGSINTASKCSNCGKAKSFADTRCN